ncbi:HAD hydrolase-like protein [bacterium]|nr:HAD hydrolase-like protein [bacterium]
MKRMLLFAFLLSVLTACSGPQLTVQVDSTEPAAAPAAEVKTEVKTEVAEAPKLPNDIHWFRNSAEQRGCYLQAYAVATRLVEEKAKNLEPGSWAVVLDADETVLDNSQFQKEIALAGERFSYPAWTAWCRREEAKPLPGAVEFLEAVHKLGGKIAIVTNRSQEVQDASESNFRKEGIPFDQMLCRTPESGNKNPRYESILDGTTPAGWAPMNVVLYVGDNIQDFPQLRQKDMLHADDSAYAKFGTDYILLPNPMYGSWPWNPME